MHPVGRFHNSFRRLLGPLALAALVAPPTQADLLHKYTFNNNTAEDSVGGLHGTVVDNTGIHSYTGGAINLTANNTPTNGGISSNQDFSLPTTVGAYVDLPNDIFTNAVMSQAGGLYGQVTLETWFTVQQNRNWAEVAVFGTSNNGENTAVGAGAQSYVAIIPQSGPGDFRATTKSPSLESPLIGEAPLTPNQRHHVVFVMDQNDTDGGVNLNGTATLYLNNGAPVRAPIQPFIDTMINNNNWLGRSQWPDPLFDGLIDEFRIYDHALTATEVAANFTAGPEPAPLPVLVVNRDTGAITLANQSAGNIQIKGYTIESAAGSLNPAGWQSIDTGNTFDPNGTWTSSSLTNLEIAESNTGGTLDGGSLAATSSRGIGTPWFKTPIQDLTFSFTL
ncbi:MAG TPA: LamG domain-containing protein, partial [Lacipirellula sp.]